MLLMGEIVCRGGKQVYENRTLVFLFKSYASKCFKMVLDFKEETEWEMGVMPQNFIQ